MANKLKCPYSKEELKEIRSNFKGDKFLCPICGKDLHMTNDVFSYCANESCEIYTFPIPNVVSEYLEDMALALIQSQRDLQIAVGTLRSIGACNNRVSNLALQKMAHECLAQITHDNKE